MKRIGILGGTFDPVHIGHIALANTAAKEADLDHVLLIPAGDPPHKDKVITPFCHRAEMVRIGIGSEPLLLLSTVEQDLPKPSYSIDTIKVLLESVEPDTSLYFILGTDAFIDILSWKSYRELLRTVHPLIGYRTGASNSELENIREFFGYVPADDRWIGTGGLKDVFFLHGNIPEISSTELRAAIGNNRTAHLKLDPKVHEYIKLHKLYT